MKPFNILLSTGANIASAVHTLSEQINKEYADKACQLQQIFLLPQMVAQSQVAADPRGQPQFQTVINLVAVITEEPEFDSFQRNYKELFDYINNNRATFAPILINWLESLKPDAMPGT